MKQTKLSLLAAGLMAAGMMVSGQAMAADNATATVSATVLEPIAITKVEDMVFGNLIAGNGAVTLTPAGVRSGTGTLPASTGVKAAKFDVTGTGNSTFSISYTGSSNTLSDGSNTMGIAFITDTTASSKTSGTITEGTLSSGAVSIYAGAVLTVDALQAAGAYTGSLKVTVAYN